MAARVTIKAVNYELARLGQPRPNLLFSLPIPQADTALGCAPVARVP
jgi:hypothetical protein